MIRVAFGAGDTTVLSCDGAAITLAASFSAPPGKPLSGTLPGGLAVEVKVHGSKRQDDGSFVISGRLVNASKAVKDALVPGSPLR